MEVAHPRPERAYGWDKVRQGDEYRAPKPTNEHIIRMLDQILRELATMKERNEQLATHVRKIAETVER